MKLKVLDNQLGPDSTFSLSLAKPQNFSFYSGQYLDIQLEIEAADKKGKTRSFSIASSPTEANILISSRIGISDFKKKMQALQPGDIVSVTHPAGTFVLDETAPAIFLAGGIGITPFRSMIKYALDNKLKTPIKLIYMNNSNQFVFKDELDNWQKDLSNLKILYHDSSSQGRFLLTSSFQILDSIYYLAGPPKMVGDFKTNLLQLEVDESDIRVDSFEGY